MVLRVSPGTFIGRVQELDEFRGVLANARLVTLTGTAGIGKTRMAIEVAGQVRRAFPEGVWFVPLADLEPAAGREALAAAAMAALGIDDGSSGAPENTLLDFLRDRHLLLVLDNCEHVLQASAALAADILTVASDVRILATSRESLGIAGERTHVLPPLPLPEPGRPYELRELLRIESVHLLVERAQAVDARFTITEQDVADVAQLCSQLDGLPLAIELAATRLRSMSVGQMVERLEDRFSLLAAGDRSALPRQSSLRALIDWSYNLCAPRTRLVWTRLTVFPATLDCHAAEAVCGFGEIASEEVFDHLDRLVAQSVLLTERSGGTIRYRLPTTLREYAVEYLEDPAALLTLRQRLRDHLLLKASATIASWAGAAQRGALTELGADHPSLESALGWSLATEGEREQGLRLATKFRYHWLLGGYLAVGRGWLERFLNVVTEASPSRGEALWTVAWVALIQGDRIGALRHLRDLAAIAKELEDPALATHVSHWTALHAAFSGDVEDYLWDDGRWQLLSDRHIELARSVGALSELPLALNARVIMLTLNGELAAAGGVIQELQAAADATGTKLPPYAALGVAAMSGREAQTAALVGATISDVSMRGEGNAITVTEWASAVLNNGVGNYHAAMTAAERAVEHQGELLAPAWATAELVEAAARSERVDIATEALRRLADTTSASGTDWALGIEARSRALLSEGDPAEHLYRESIERLGRTRVRAELARAHLLYGEWLRRQRRRIDARAQLRTAHDMLETMGMEAFANRARRELRATGETARKRTIRTVDQKLTPQEAQIAAMARDGLSNPEIGARLFISTRTVQYHLRKVFTKLGIESRGQLARALPTDPPTA